jgi:hypothetical protein
MLWLTEEMDFVSPCIPFVFGRMIIIGFWLVRCFALLCFAIETGKRRLHAHKAVARKQG